MIQNGTSVNGHPNDHDVMETNNDGVYREAIFIFVPMSEGN